MKQKILFLFAAMLPLVASGARETVEIDGIWYNLYSGTKVAQVTDKGSNHYDYWDEYSGSITIPNTVTYEDVQYNVTSIGSSAFDGCSSLTAINIPESVMSIGNWAFDGCSSLTAINIPESVTSIGNYAFRGCSSLTAINIPESVKSIGNEAFYDCRSLTTVDIRDIAAWCNIKFSDAFSNPLLFTRNLYLNGELVIELTIPESVTSIRDYTFYCCSSLTAITIPESVKSIGNEAFSNCSSLTAITIPKSVKSIGDWAFRNCSSLTAINIPEGVTSINWGTFEDCRNLTTITLPEGITGILLDAFKNCRSLTAITLPESLTSIGEDAFYNCENLTTITIPKDVMGISDDAFNGCTRLTTIVLQPLGWTSISSRAFAYCKNLLDVYCYASTIPSHESDLFYESLNENTTLHVPASSLDVYKITEPWSSFRNIVALTEEEMGMKNSEITNQKSELIHDLRGHRVDNPTKGDIYIVGGKKMVW